MQQPRPDQQTGRHRHEFARIVAATFQIAAGVIAVLLCAWTVVTWADPSSDEGQGMFLGIGFVLGAGLLIIWSVARKGDRWLRVLAVVTGVLAAGMALLTIVIIRSAFFDSLVGLWAPAWVAVIDTLLWALIAIAAVVELRSRHGRDTEAHRPWQLTADAIAAPLAVLIGLTVLVGVAGPGWMVRVNARTSAAAAAAPPRASTLTGEERWTDDFTASAAVATTAGLAVPVARDRRHSAGVIMIDPVTGTQRWRHQLHGVDDPPNLSDRPGAGLLVSSFGADAPTYSLSPDTGRIERFWRIEPPPVAGPPVSFHRAPHGTNSVSVYNSSGAKLWTYRPDRCADPRDAGSTPTVVLVAGYRCAGGGNELIGLDPATGDRRWTQPSDTESVPVQLLVRAGYQLESDGDFGNDDWEGGEIRRRDLTTGTISWTVPSTPRACYDPPSPALSEHTLYVTDCAAGGKKPNRVTAYAIDTGAVLWRRTLDHPVTSLTAVDDQRAVALTLSEATKQRCAAELVAASDSNTLLTVPQYDNDDYAHPVQPGSVSCFDSSVLRVAGTMVLQFKLIKEPNVSSMSSATRYRLIALA